MPGTSTGSRKMWHQRKSSQFLIRELCAALHVRPKQVGIFGRGVFASVEWWSVQVARLLQQAAKAGPFDLQYKDEQRRLDELRASVEAAIADGRRRARVSAVSAAS